MKYRNIELRKFRKTDAIRLAELANTQKISRNLRDGFPNPYAKEDADKFIQNCMKQNPTTIFAIECNGEYVGNIGLHPAQDVYRKSAEIGFFIGEAYWNKGIATISVNLICDYGFKNLDIVRIHAGVFEYNKASQRVFEKCGFGKEGVFKKSVFKNEKLWDEIRYSKICLMNENWLEPVKMNLP